MPINESLAIGADESAAVNPTALQSEAHIAGVPSGQVSLWSLAPGGEYKQIASNNGQSSFTVLTPDPAVFYKFKGVGLAAATHVYFGP